MLTGRWQWIAYFLAPLALLFAVAFQRYNVEVHDQSAWSGGGFGMFSTVDAPGTRMTRAYALTDRGPALILEPPLPESERLVYTQPTQERLDAAVRHLAGQEWRVFGAGSYDELEPYLPDYLQRYLRQKETRQEFLGEEAETPYPGMVAFAARRSPPRPSPDGVTVEGVRLEVWRSAFDGERNELSWRLIRASEAPSQRLAPSSEPRPVQ